MRAMALCLCLLLAPLASASSANDPPLVQIDQEQGMTTEGVLNLTGLFFDEEAPADLGWRLFDGFEVVAEGDLADGLESAHHGDQGSSRSAWAWHLDLDLSPHAPCACVVEITGTDGIGQSSSAWQILFAGDSEVDLPPQVLIEGPMWTELLSGAILIEGVALDDAETAPLVQWAISQDPTVAIACMQPRIETPDTLTWTNTSEIDEIGHFEIPFDSSLFEDGAYTLVVRAVDGEGMASPSACVPVGLDNHSPVAHIAAIDDRNESDVALIFDGSGSSDEFWGREELVFLWWLEHEGGDRWIESGRDLRTFTSGAAAGRAGGYTLTLTVADGGGFSDTTQIEFNITNLAPVAAMRIDSMPIADGGRLTLPDSPRWWLDCSDSSDTSNDAPDLDCTWSLDGQPIMSGWTRQLDQPADLGRTHTLTLEVRDDDGASDSVTVTFGVVGTPSDPAHAQSEASDLPAWAQLLLFAVLLSGLIAAGVLVSRHHSPSAMPIPKWKKRGKRLDTETQIDQTEDIEAIFDDL